MTSMRWLRRFGYWLRPSERQAELREELAFHHELRAAELRRGGLSPEAADAAAHKAMGNMTYMREEARALWIAPGIEAAMTDCGSAWRSIRRSRALTMVVIVIIGLCIGVTTSAYAVLRHLLLAPLPYPDGNRIVSLQMPDPDDPARPFAMNMALFQSYAARSGTLEEFSAVQSYRSSIGERADTARDSIWAASATPSLLPMMRVLPMLGRAFRAADALPGAAPVALLSESVWRSRFGADSSVIGRTVRVGVIDDPVGKALVDNSLRTIIGVVPQGVRIPTQFGDHDPVDIWVPLDVTAEPSHWLEYALARLRPGVTSAEATRELQAIRKMLPDTGWLKRRYVEVQTPAEQVGPSKQHAIEVLFAASAGLLLVACADIAGLLLIRGWERRREFAIRRTLGAGRARLVRQLVAESLFLALLGGALGLFVGWMGLRTLIATRPPQLELLDAAHLDPAAILWTLGVAAATGLLVGLGPIMFASDRSLSVVLQTGGAAGGRMTPASRRGHSALVVAQVALSLMFVVAAGVVARAFITLLLVPIGYQPAGLIEVRIRRTPSAVSVPRRPLSPGERTAAIEAVRATLARVAGVTEVAVGMLPLSNAGPAPRAVEGPDGVRPVTLKLTGLTYGDPDHFRVVRLPILSGRAFDADPTAAAGEVIINQALAKRLWPNGGAVGARLQEWTGRWLTVVGIAGDVQLPGSTFDLFRLQVYRPGVMPGGLVSLVLRARGDARTMRPLLASAIERANLGVRLDDVIAGDRMLELAFAAPRFAVVLFGTFAVLAVVLAAAGLFGNIAFAVARRTHEIGVRVAVGADPGSVGRMVLFNGLRLAAVGCVLGLIASWFGMRAMSASLYEIRPASPAVLAGAAALLVVVAILASIVPVQRALRVDPVDVLRAD